MTDPYGDMDENIGIPWEPNHRPSLRRGLAILATVLVIGLALGFAAGRALAREPVTHIASQEAKTAPRAVVARRGTFAPPILPPYPAADVEESVGGTLEIPAAVIGGRATWYDDGPGLYGAVPSWHWGDRPYSVRVCHGSRCVVVTVRDFCGCPGNRVIDLSPSAFRRLAPLSRGVVTVTVQDARGGPLPTPPATDTGP